MIVEIYRNLTARLWSVRCAKTKRVVAHAPLFTIINCTFHVSEQGRVKVLKSRRKNVHAYVKGELSSYDPALGTEIHYDPYKEKHFFKMIDGNKITEAKKVNFAQDMKCYLIEE